MNITSTEFEDGGTIPEKYTCEGENTNPPLTITDIPDGTQSVTIIMDDPDSFSGVWHHWIIWNLMPEDPLTIREAHEPRGQEGKNSFELHGYGGPCPKEGTHRYYFRAYALDRILELPEDTTKEMLETEMVGHVVDKAEIYGIYEII